MPIKLSVVVPCYNEEKRIDDGVKHYTSFLLKQPYKWELILVNDGSKDKTLNIMNDYAAKNKNIKVVSYKVNKGKGYAIGKGIKEVNGKYILFSDIDHSVPIQTVKDFFEFFSKNFDVVIGSRRVLGSKILIHQHAVRELLGRGFTLLVNLLIYWGIKDATCGFKAFKKDVAQKIFSKILVYDWAFDAEILFLCKKYKLKIVQAPVSWKDSKGSKVSLKKDVLLSLYGILKIRLNNLSGKY